MWRRKWKCTCQTQRLASIRSLKHRRWVYLWHVCNGFSAEGTTRLIFNPIALYVTVQRPLATLSPFECTRIQLAFIIKLSKELTHKSNRHPASRGKPIFQLSYFEKADDSNLEIGLHRRHSETARISLN